FSYGDVRVNKSNPTMKDIIEISVDVTNTGKVAGEEVVQLYVRDLAADVARPVKELKGFEKIKLAAGERKTVTFRLNPGVDLAYWNQDLKFKADPGKFNVFVGGSSDKVKETSFELVK
ncbi:MAG: fibronectin type III-like domain-contianing protein, partial [Saprospiraceae bacterium]|nr:fibronectin type III-like domain-contianing protein [Saprospiraceae bacterium]